MKTEYLIRQQTNPGALLNTDNEGKKAYLARRNRLKESDSRIDKLEAKVDSLSETLNEILGLLKKDIK